MEGLCSIHFWKLGIWYVPLHSSTEKDDKILGFTSSLLSIDWLDANGKNRTQNLVKNWRRKLCIQMFSYLVVVYYHEKPINSLQKSHSNKLQRMLPQSSYISIHRRMKTNTSCSTKSTVSKEIKFGSSDMRKTKQMNVKFVLVPFFISFSLKLNLFLHAFFLDK